MKDTFPDDQKYLISALKDKLDLWYPETVQTYRPVLQSRNVVSYVSNPNNQDQIYTIDSNILRFDHTHGALNQAASIPQRSFGPVFRRGAKYRGRYRQFYQYDVDYLHQDYGLQPFERTLNLNTKLNFRVNDLNLLKKELNLESRISETEPFREMISRLDPESYTKKFFEMYPTLIDRVVVDPQIVRGWDYYQGLVFEGYYKSVQMSLVAGGTYKRAQKLHLGISYGINRMIEVLGDDLKSYFSPKRLVLVVFLNSLPYNLISMMTEANINYVLKRMNSSLYYIRNNLKKKLRNTNLQIVRTLIVSDVQDRDMVYRVRQFQEDTRTLTLEELRDVLSWT